MDQPRRVQFCQTATFVSAFLFSVGLAQADETFVTIQRINGNQLTVIKSDSGSGRGVRGGAAAGKAVGPMRPGFGSGRPGAATQPTVITVPADAKITSAMRERRTFEFRVGAELAGGLKHRVFREMQEPLAARIVTDGNRVTEINVIIPETDINQSGTDSSGQTVIAVRPKRPPMKPAKK